MNFQKVASSLTKQREEKKLLVHRKSNGSATQVLHPQNDYILTAQTVNICSQLNEFEPRHSESFKFWISAKIIFVLQYINLYEMLL